jgi:hypothetical protein
MSPALLTDQKSQRHDRQDMRRHHQRMQKAAEQS